MRVYDGGELFSLPFFDVSLYNTLLVCFLLPRPLVGIASKVVLYAYVVGDDCASVSLFVVDDSGTPLLGGLGEDIVLGFVGQAYWVQVGTSCFD